MMFGVSQTFVVHVDSRGCFSFFPVSDRSSRNAAENPRALKTGCDFPDQVREDEDGIEPQEHPAFPVGEAVGFLAHHAAGADADQPDPRKDHAHRVLLGRSIEPEHLQGDADEDGARG